MNRPQPPAWLTRLLYFFCDPDLLEELGGDLDELFFKRARDLGENKARLLYLRDVLSLLRPHIIKSKSHHYPGPAHLDMLQNYLKIALRNLLQNKVYSLINIIGLAIGITTCMLITLYVIDEISYDKQHVDKDRIFRVISQVKGEKWVAASAPVSNGLKKDFSEIDQTTRLLRMPGVDKFLLKDESSQKQFYETNGYYVDSTFFRIFTYDFQFGDKRTALNEPNSIIISDQIALKMFGDSNPVDKIISVGLPFGTNNYTVKAVFKTREIKSHIPAHFFLSMNNNDVGQWVKSQTNWANNSVFHTYIKLGKGSNAGVLEAKLDGFLKRNGGSDFSSLGFSKTLYLQPLQDIYLHSNFGFEIAPNGNIKFLYVFGSIAGFLLLIACINFMNLSTARSEKRAKEVGIRKVIGANKTTLIGQFMGESLLMSCLALLLSVFLIWLLIPVFNNIAEKHLVIHKHPEIFIWLTGLTLLTGLLSGLYPALYLSSFSPIMALKGKVKNNLSAVLIRKGLVVFQFTVSMILILGAILIGRQMEFLSNKNLGFNKNQKLILPLQSSESVGHYKILKDELLRASDINRIAKGSSYPGIENVLSMLFYAGNKSKKNNVDISFTNIDKDYLKTLDIQLLQGRGFSAEFTADTNSLVLNEAAVNKLGYNAANAIGKKIHYEFQGNKQTLRIIGVVKNYHFEGLQKQVKPMALSISPFFSSTNNYLILDVKSKAYKKLISGIEKVWRRLNPDSPFEYSFLDSDFHKNYEKEERTSQLVSYFAMIAIAIACLGLFGLATFTAEQRSKEIGIRKVLGASALGITKLLSGDFLKLILLAIMIASPLAWWAMHEWLSDFAYRTPITWSMFLTAAGLVIVIGWATICFQSIKAALMDPVKSMKCD